MQQGGYPSPFDRNVATKMAAKTVNWLCEQLNTCAARDGELSMIAVSHQELMLRLRYSSR